MTEQIFKIKNTSANEFTPRKIKWTLEYHFHIYGLNAEFKVEEVKLRKRTKKGLFKK